MFAAVQQKLVAALTSGKYKQARGSLKRIDPDGARHCCLGVLCELYAAENGGKFVPDPELPVSKRAAYGREGGEAMFDGDTNMPSHRVLAWAGLDQVVAADLAEKNDAGASFKQIATAISKLPVSEQFKVVRWANQYGTGVKKVRI
jgi:hypothetical protein